MSERDKRRWTRLRPESLTACAVQILDGDRPRRTELIDLSPGGIAIRLPNAARQPFQAGQRIRLRVTFQGHARVELPALVLRVDGITGGPCRLALTWLQDPPSWNGTDRREYPRLVVGRDDGFAVRIANEHLLGLWTRAAILDLSSDRGLRIEGMGGPIWLLPGMLVDVHLDLPLVRETPLRCQVLWVRPDRQGKVQAGLRVLDLESPSLQALDEWIAMAGIWSPRDLVSRGFATPTIPGQFRFRSAEAMQDRTDLLAHLRTASHRSTRIGFESLAPLPDESTSELGLVGCWDGSRLVASVAFDLAPERNGGSADEIALQGAGFELDWFEREILRGLWGQALRVFLASERSRMRVWCPDGRERLYTALGLTPEGDPRADGCWHVLRRETVLVGSGLSPFTWAWVYGEVSSYHARQGARLGWKARTARLLRLGLDAVLSEIMLPPKRRRIGLELRRWCEEATAP